MPRAPKTAVLVPCFNEALTINKVVSDFRMALPFAALHVCDNGSTDGTAAIAEAAGAEVHLEPLPGKGNAVRRLFADVEADVYVLVDGDDTYEADDVRSLIDAMITQRLDLVNGRRVASAWEAYRPGHRMGNRVLTSIVSMIFGRRLSDMLSGYKVFSRRFVKSFPCMATGFEIETELVVHALELQMPMAEIDTRYRDRPPGSSSKLSTFRDGWRILKTILIMVKQERPLPFFTIMFGLLASLSVVLAIPVIVDFVHTGLVARQPTAVLATGIMLLGFLSLASGFILDTVTHGRREMKRLHYLAIRGVNAGRPSTSLVKVPISTEESGAWQTPDAA